MAELKEFEQKIPLLAVVGPTASGKTALSVAIAQRVGGEVVSADSMQIYRDMDIGTAKPTTEEMAGVPHHLIDFLDISQQFSVAQYVELARKRIADIHVRGMLPILTGGTGLYVSSVLNHIQFPEEEKDDGLRKQLEARLEREGAEALLEELRSFDPESAAKLHPNNSKRIIRAIEIYRTTGMTMTEQVARSRLQPPPYRACVLGLDYRDRAKLYDRINLRVDQMLENGLLEEAKRVLSSPYSMTAMNAIGYKELAPWVKGECTLEHAVEMLKMSTRRYAKRQLTWFRRDKQVHWIFIDECKDFHQILENSLQYMAIDGIL